MLGKFYLCVILSDTAKKRFATSTEIEAGVDVPQRMVSVYIAVDFAPARLAAWIMSASSCGRFVVHVNSPMSATPIARRWSSRVAVRSAHALASILYAFRSFVI